MATRIVLKNGYVHEDFDERSNDLLVDAIQSDDDDLPAGWVWVAGLYVQRDQIVAIAYTEESE